METVAKKISKSNNSPLGVGGTEALYQRRKKVVPNALGIFNPSSVQYAHGAIMIDADGRELIDFAGGFHGRTYMSMSLTSKVAYKTGCGPFAPEVYRIDYPSYNNKKQQISEETFAEQEIQKLKTFFKTYVRAEDVAAVIIELVQGE